MEKIIEQKEKLDLKELLEKDKEAFEKEKEAFENALLENAKNDLERKLLASTPKQHVNNCLSAVFTPGQIKRLLDPSKKRIVSNPEDISAAMSAYSYAAKAIIGGQNVTCHVNITQMGWLFLFRTGCIETCHGSHEIKKFAIAIN
jgi:hypothetical protein